jgi:hypothetical protein
MRSYTSVATCGCVEIWRDKICLEACVGEVFMRFGKNKKDKYERSAKRGCASYLDDGERSVCRTTIHDKTLCHAAFGA